MIVVDASGLVEVLLNLRAARQVIQRLMADRGSIAAPGLIDIEVCHVVRRYALLKEISGQRGKTAMEDLAEFPLERYAHSVLLPRMWELRNNLSAYDAAYVALAEGLDAPLLTLDRRLATAKGHRAKIELVEP